MLSLSRAFPSLPVRSIRSQETDPSGANSGHLVWEVKDIARSSLSVLARPDSHNGMGRRIECLGGSIVRLLPMGGGAFIEGEADVSDHRV